MSQPARPDVAAVVAAFLARFVADRDRGELAALDVYQARFPGFESVIAREYRELIDNAEPLEPPAPALPPELARFGAYEIVREIGRGGQGVVYLAEDERNGGVRVALKVLAPQLAPSSALRQRFQREAEVAMRLDHPGICRIHEVGDEGGLPFIAMQYVEGETLARRLAAAHEARSRSHESTWAESAGVIDAVREDAAAPRVERMLRFLEEAARTLHVAHEASLVHRDVKPGNLMVTREGRPVVLDFGLARDEHDDDALTRTGQAMGTPAYMSPEQIAARREDLDRRSDVYSLGVTAYECLTLQRPFCADTREGLYRRILTAPAPDPLKGNPHLPRSLKRVLNKALEKDRNRRYATALELADDLRRVRIGEPVQARAIGRVAGAWRMVRRHPVAASWLAMLVIVAGAWVTWRELARREDEARLREIYAETSSTRGRFGALATASRLRSLSEEAEGLWPARPEKVPHLESWLQRARQAGRGADVFRGKLATLRRRGTRREDGQGRPVWTFPEAEAAWEHDRLVELISAMEEVATRVSEVERRLSAAKSLEHESIEKHRESWEAVMAAIRTSPVFRGLELSPQMGLVPLGQDPRSGLFEFAHLASGRAPHRGPSGRLQLDGESGVVLILLPGGTFHMGAQRRDPGAPNYDPRARAEETPVASRSVAPFFVAKHELTQGQWLRMTGQNPSRYRAGHATQGVRAVLTHPVESVSWDEASWVLRRVDLGLPSEVQWEYAARGGTRTAWWSGDDPQGLAGHANVADASARQGGVVQDGVFELDDRFPAHGPVDALVPNPFGLHGIVGNVAEWCADRYSAAGEGASAPGDRSVRGGSFRSRPQGGRSAARMSMPAGNRSATLGVRAVRRLER